LPYHKYISDIASSAFFAQCLQTPPKSPLPG
jgi:hypothetical protein